MADIAFRQVPADSFHTAISRIKERSHGAFVHVYSPEEYQHMRTFLSADGLVGYAITSEHDLVSVFNASDVKGAGKAAVQDALRNGAKSLDAFEGFLPQYYKQFGFNEYKRDPFNEEYAPKDWNYEQHGRPDVVYMKHGAESMDPSIYKILRNGENTDVRIAGFSPTPMGGSKGVAAHSTTEVWAQYPKKNRGFYTDILFAAFCIPLNERGAVEPNNAAHYQQQTGWMTDLEVFHRSGRGMTGDLIYHRERSFKDKKTALADFQDMTNRLTGMPFLEFLNIAEPTMGKLSKEAKIISEEHECANCGTHDKLDDEGTCAKCRRRKNVEGLISPREQMTRLGREVQATEPPMKIGPPKDQFEGDMPNNEFTYDLSFWKPFSDGVDAAPMSRGELIPDSRGPGSTGIPMQPTQPGANWDDSKRREDVPPIYRPERSGVDLEEIFDKTAEGFGEYAMPEAEEWETETIPTPIWAAWKKAHGTKELAENRISLKIVENFLRDTATFVARARKLIGESGVAAYAQKLNSINEQSMNNPKLIGAEQGLWKIFEAIDKVLNGAHYDASRALGIDSSVWYNKTAGEESGEFDTHEPPSIGDVEPKNRYLSGETKVAVDIAPIPTEQAQSKDTSLVHRLPNDLRERYAELASRVHQYTRAIAGNLNALDVYKYRNSPPREWVERELPNAQVDWDDLGAWKRYLKRYDHKQVADWLRLKSVDASVVAPKLHLQWAVSADQHDFNKWFRKTKPAWMEDESLVTFSRDQARNSDHEIGQKYAGWWKKRYLGKVYGQAYKLAKERWTDYLKGSAFEFAKPEYKEHLDTVKSAAEGKKVPLSNLISSLKMLPFPDDHRADIEGFEQTLASLTNEGMQAFDMHRPPVSRDDRLYGDRVSEGTQWVTVRRIQGIYPEATEPFRKNRIAALQVTYREALGEALPLQLLQAGDQYFLMEESERNQDVLQAIRASSRPVILAEVTRIIPGSSIQKRVISSWDDFRKKSRLLSNAIHEIQAGTDHEAVFLKYSREFGPGLRGLVNDYFYVKDQQQKEADAGSIDDTAGGSGCSSFWNDQTADNCAGCTFNVGTGGLEYGYGGCVLTDLFLNAPEDGGHGRSDQSGYNDENTPGKPINRGKEPGQKRLHD